MNICYNLSNSLPPEKLEMLVSFKRIAEDQGVPFLLVGATVRQLILNDHYEIEERRKTQDVDFGVMLSDWDSYERLADALVNSGGFRREIANRPHEFRFGPERNWIDIIPFGAISQGNAIAWPPERASIMNVTGYDDVFRAAVEIDFGGGTRISSASLPGYVLLKLFAWNDRPERTKDLQDIWHILEHYYVAGEVGGRLHNQHPDLLNLPAEKFCDLAGARILGLDLHALCSPATLEALRQLLDRECAEGDESNILNVFEREAESRGVYEPYEYANTCWNEFVKGCTESPR